MRGNTIIFSLLTLLLFAGGLTAVDLNIPELQPESVSMDFIDQISTQSNTTATPCWTIMIYMSADNDLEKYAVRDMKELIEGSKGLPDCVSILVQIDRHPNASLRDGYSGEALPGEATENTGTVRYEIRNGTLTKLQDLGEQDMSLGSTLENFTEWAVTKCPAPKTALIIWNHGTGDSGVGVDESSNGKQLSLGAIRQALENVQNKTGNALDVLGFDACHMGASEVFTEFSGLAKVLIGSQEVEPGDGWDYESILDGLKDAPEEVDHERFGTIVVETYERWYRSTGRNKTTLAAYDLADAPKFTSAMSTLTDCLVKALQNETTAAEMARAIEWARNESKSFKGNDQIDLYDFLGHLQQATDDVDIRRKAQDVRGIIERMRIAQHVGTAAGDAFGISIYFDHNSSITYTWSKGTALKFNDSTSWEQVIKLYNGFYKNATHRTWLRNNPINASSRLDVIGSLSGPVTPGESILDDLSTSGLTVKPTIKVDTFANFSHLDFWMSEPGSRLPPYLLGSFPIESVNGLDIPVPDVPGGWYDIWGTPRVPGAFLDPAIGSDVIFGDPLWVPGPEPLLNPQFFNPPGFESEGYTPPIFGPGDTIVTPIQIFNYGGVTSPDAPLEVIWYDSDGAVILVENFNPGPIAPGEMAAVYVSPPTTDPGRYTCEIQQPGTLVDVLSNSPRDQATPTCDYQVQDPNQYDMRFEIQGNESQSYFDPSLIGSPVNFYVTTPTFDPALVFFVHYLIAGEPLIFDSYLYTNMAIEVNNLTPGFDSPGGYTYNVSLPAWGFDQYDTQFYGGYDYFVGLFTSLTAGNLLPAKYHSFYAPVAGLAPLVSIDDLTVTPAPCGSPWTLDVTMTNHGQVDANITYFYYDLYPYSDEWILYNSDHDGLIVPANSSVTFTRYPPVSCTAGERPYGFFDSYISIGYESVEGVSQEDFERCIYLEGFYIPPQDSTAPLISVGGSLDLDATALTVSVTDDHLYTYSLFVDGLFIDAGHVPGEGTDRVFTIDLGDLPDGVYDVTILVADLSLNNVRLDLVLDVTGGVGTTTTTSDTPSATSTTGTPSTTSTTTSDTGTSETTTSSATTSTSTSATSETSDPPGSTTTPNVPVRVPVLALLGVATVFVSRRRR